MSEIFSYFKRTASERRKEQVAEAHPVEIPIAPPAAEPPEEKSVTADAEKPCRAVEISEAGRFDLSAADHQLRSILDPLSLVGEQFRLLRSKLGLMQKQRRTKTLLVTSAVPKEGKTFMACGLAGVFAQEPGRRIVLIDADMRKPRSGRNMGLNGTSQAGGLSRVLRGEIGFQAALLKATDLEFYFLPSGPLPPNPSELLSSPLLEQTLKSATEAFDWVVIDSPPVLALADATLIAPLCDAVLLVIHANATPSKLIVDSVQRIGRERICGIALNRQKHVHSSRYYYHYYHKDSK